MLKKVPHTYVIVFSIVIIAAILTWFIPPGKYIEEETIIDGEKQTQMVFYYEEDLPDEH